MAFPISASRTVWLWLTVSLFLPVSAQRLASPAERALTDVRDRWKRQVPDPLRVTKYVPRSATSDAAYAFFDAAYTELRSDELDAAAADFVRGLNLSPERTDVRKDLAYTYLWMGQDDAARKQLLLVIANDPLDYHSMLEVAFLNYSGGQVPLKSQAWALFTEVAAKGDPISQNTAAAALQYIDSTTRTSAVPFVEAIRKNPQDLSSHYRLGLLLEQRMDLAEALSHFQIGELAGQTSPSLEAGRILIMLGRNSDATATLTRVAASTENLFLSEEARELLKSINADLPDIP